MRALNKGLAQGGVEIGPFWVQIGSKMGLIFDPYRGQKLKLGKKFFPILKIGHF